MNEKDHAPCDASTQNGLEYPDRVQLENQLTALEQELTDYKDKNLRLMAQISNLQRRADLDVRDAHRYGTERLMRDLLPVSDGLMRGLDSVREAGSSTQTASEGMQLTLDLLLKALKQHGVEVIEPQEGAPFDPEQHDAVSTAASPETPSGAILKTVQAGYSLHGRVLRAAMVVVVA